MMKDETQKRVFFAFEVNAPWPSQYPKGRNVDLHCRHLTLAFLGNVDYPALEGILTEFPKPPFTVGPVGHFDKCLSLPKRHPHVIAWNVKWGTGEDLFNEYQLQIAEWLRSHQYKIDERPFLSHVTIARSPFDEEKWFSAFSPLPVAVMGLHLYESVGNLSYKPLWTYPLVPPFQEFDHTADIAFLISGKTIEHLHENANTALAFKYPPLLKYMASINIQTELPEVVIALNQLISQADSEIGCPLKAVSFHGDIKEKENILQWEMIVDV